MDDLYSKFSTPSDNYPLFSKAKGTPDSPEDEQIPSLSADDTKKINLALGMLEKTAKLLGHDGVAKAAKQSKTPLKASKYTRLIHAGSIASKLKANPLSYSAKDAKKWLAGITISAGIAHMILSYAGGSDGAIDRTLKHLGIDDEWRTWFGEGVDAEIATLEAVGKDLSQPKLALGYTAAVEAYNALDEHSTTEERRTATLMLAKMVAKTASAGAKTLKFDKASLALGVLSLCIGGAQVYYKGGDVNGAPERFNEFKTSAKDLVTQQIHGVQASIKHDKRLNPQEVERESKYYDNLLQGQLDYLDEISHEEELLGAVRSFANSSVPGDSAIRDELRILAGEVEGYARTLKTRETRATVRLENHLDTVDAQLELLNSKLDYLTSTAPKTGMSPHLIAQTRHMLTSIKIPLLSHRIDVIKAMELLQPDVDSGGYLKLLDSESPKARAKWAIEAHKVVHAGERLDIASRIEKASSQLP